MTFEKPWDFSVNRLTPTHHSCYSLAIHRQTAMTGTGFRVPAMFREPATCCKAGLRPHGSDTLEPGRGTTGTGAMPDRFSSRLRDAPVTAQRLRSFTQYCIAGGVEQGFGQPERSVVAPRCGVTPSSTVMDEGFLFSRKGDAMDDGDGNDDCDDNDFNLTMGGACDH